MTPFKMSDVQTLAMVGSVKIIVCMNEMCECDI